MIKNNRFLSQKETTAASQGIAIILYLEQESGHCFWFEFDACA